MLYRTPRYVVTLDTDWVPAFVLDYVLSLLTSFNLPATVFCTSPYALENISGITPALHPNLMADSSQGTSQTETLKNLKSLYPGACGVRTHRLYWHSSLYDLFAEHGVHYDSSVFMPLQAYLVPNSHLGLTRFPIWWTDAFHVLSGFDVSRFTPPGRDEPGLKVLLFHPIHVYCNSRQPRETSRRLVSWDLFQCSEKDLAGYRNSGQGMESLFLNALRWLSAHRDQLSSLPALLPDAAAHVCLS
jgi:hypothetical protein